MPENKQLAKKQVKYKLNVVSLKLELLSLRTY